MVAMQVMVARAALVTVMGVVSFAIATAPAHARLAQARPRVQDEQRQHQ